MPFFWSAPRNESSWSVVRSKRVLLYRPERWFGIKFAHMLVTKTLFKNFAESRGFISNTAVLSRWSCVCPLQTVAPLRFVRFLDFSESVFTSASSKTYLCSKNANIICLVLKWLYLRSIIHNFRPDIDRRLLITWMCEANSKLIAFLPVIGTSN